MSDIFSRAAKPAKAMCGELYRGRVFLLEAQRASLALCDALDVLLEEHFGAEPRLAHARLSDQAFFEAVGGVRRALFEDADIDRLSVELIAQMGFDLSQVAYDPWRLRAIKPGGHLNPRAKAIYYAHRDTWYGHPQAMITWWVPLDELEDWETFVFYPERFAREVGNDSEIFNYDDWVRDGPELRIGWQHRDAGLEARYPSVTEEDLDPGPGLRFGCRRGQNLLFAGSQFHRTPERGGSRTRFSIDFRLVDLDDHRRGLGAPNVDNRSRGSALRDYRRTA